MEDHKISVHTDDGIWLIGTIDDCTFEAKVCDVSSGFGIDCGRVIKLFALKRQRQRQRHELFSYERGWDRYPQGVHKDLCLALVKFCESLPEQGTWRKTFRKEHHFLVTEDGVLEYEDDNT